MKKAKITLLALVIAVLSVCCFAFVACGNEGENNPTNQVKYTITWTVNENVEVKAVGYDALPTELVEGTEVSFTATPKTGWAVSSVAPSANVKKQSDGSYKFTATKDLEIRINAREEVDHLVVTKPESLVYYSGEKLITEEDGVYTAPEGFSVKAVYKTEREEDISPNNYVVQYQNDGAEAFSLGDTSFGITFGGITETVQLSQAVVGKIVLNLDADGYWSEEARALLNDKFGEENITSEIDAKKNNNVICTILFAEAFEEAFTLPNPSKTFTNKAGSKIDFPFKQWNGIESATIAKDTTVGFSADAIYNVRLVEFYSLSFTTKTITEKVTVTEGEGDSAQQVEKDVQVVVPYFIINGKFLAADSAQLVLKEGNEPVTELLGTEIEMNGDNEEFSLEFDLRILVRWVNPDADATKKVTLKSAWNDIRFRASQGTSSVDQIIDLNDYPDDFVDLGDTLEAEVDGVAYQFAYQIWTGTSSIGRDLKLYYQDCPSTVTKKASLVNHEFTVTTPATEEGGEPTVTKRTLPAIEVTGKDFSAKTEDDLKALAEGYLTQPQVLDNWRDVNMLKDVTVNFAEHSFTIYLSVDDVKSGEVVFLHMGAGGNFQNASLGTKALEASDPEYTYTLRLFSGATGDSNTWKNGLVVIEYKYIKEATADPVGIEVEDSKAYLVVTGTYKNYATAEEFIAKIGQLDLENADDGNDKIIIDKSKITVVLDAENGTYKLKADITDVKAGAYWVHLTGVLAGNGDIGNDSGIEPIACGDKTFGYVNKVFGWGNKNVLTITGGAAQPEPEPAPEETPAE